MTVEELQAKIVEVYQANPGHASCPLMVHCRVCDEVRDLAQQIWDLQVLENTPSSEAS